MDPQGKLKIDFFLIEETLLQLTFGRNLGLLLLLLKKIVYGFFEQIFELKCCRNGI